MPREVAQLFESFKHDRLITIFIADSIDPISVSEALLNRNSTAFGTALQPESIAKSTTVRLPDDNLDAWKMMLFWMTYKKLPDCSETFEHQDIGITAHLIRSWCLGDKYDMTLFQDEVMWMLFEILQTGDDEVESHLLDFVQEDIKISKTGSVMRMLMLNYLVWFWKAFDRISSEEVNMIGDVPGFASDFAHAIDRFHYREYNPSYYVTEYFICCETKKKWEQEKEGKVEVQDVWTPAPKGDNWFMRFRQ